MSALVNLRPRWGVSGLRQAPAGLSPGRKPGVHFIGGWLGPSARLIGLEEGKLTLTQHYCCHQQQLLPARYVTCF
jgi:hypothetical protein